MISCRMGEYLTTGVVVLRELLRGGFPVQPPNGGHLVGLMIYQIWTLNTTILEKTVRQRN
jgi:hypothetical protein